MSWNIIPAVFIIIGTFMVVKIMCEQKNYFAAAMVFSSGLGFAAKMVQPPKIEKNNLQDKSE